MKRQVILTFQSGVFYSKMTDWGNSLIFMQFEVLRKGSNIPKDI